MMGGLKKLAFVPRDINVFLLTPSYFRARSNDVAD